MQAEIVDETDLFVDNERSITVNAAALAQVGGFSWRQKAGAGSLCLNENCCDCRGCALASLTALTLG